MASSETSKPTNAPIAKADESSRRYADKRTLHFEQQDSRPSWQVRARQQVDENRKTRFYWRDDSDKRASLRFAKGNRSITQRASLPLSKEICDSADNLVSLALLEEARNNDRLHDPIKMQHSSATFWDESEHEDSDSEDAVWTTERAEALRNDIVSSSSEPESTNKPVVTPTYDIPASRQERTEQKDALNESKMGLNKQNSLKNDALNMNSPLSATSIQFDMDLPPTVKKDNTQKASVRLVYDPFDNSFLSQWSEQENSTRLQKYPFPNSLPPPTRDSQLTRSSQRHVAPKNETRRPESFFTGQSSLSQDYVSSPARLVCEESNG